MKLTFNTLCMLTSSRSAQRCSLGGDAVPMQPQDEGVRLAFPVAAGAALLLPLPMGHPDEARRLAQAAWRRRQRVSVGKISA